MTDFKEILDQDPDDGVAWAVRLPVQRVAPAFDFFLGVLGNQIQGPVRRLNAASILNAMGSVSSLPRGAAIQAMGAIPALSRDSDESIRRTGLTAISSVLHSLRRKLPARSRDAFRVVLKTLQRDVPGAWEKGLLSSISAGFK